MISLIKVMVVGGRKNADFCEYRNKNGSYRRNYFICKKHDIHCVAVMEDDERNNVTHSYNRKIAMGIITQAKQKFYKMFCELKEEIDRNWI